jgi:predicted class III extradiol MEMO1 family dioxygenase
MEIIETGDPDAFKQYLQEYENTICGRHPISVLLHVSGSFFDGSTDIFYLVSFEPFSDPLRVHFVVLDAETLLDED